jgi:hypothetical protein
VHLRGAATMPSSEQNTALSTLVLDVLERVHKVGNASQAGEAAKTKSPCAIHLLAMRSYIAPNDVDSLYCVTRLVRNTGHGALTASRAVGRRRSSVERGNGCSILVEGSGLLLWGHSRARVDGWLSLMTFRRIERRGDRLLMLDRRCSILRLLLRLRLGIHLALLELRLLVVRVLVIDGRLAGHIGGLGILVHGNFILMLVIVLS